MPPIRPVSWALGLGLVWALCLTGCRQSTPVPDAPPSDAVGVVNGRPVLRAEFEAELARLSGRGVVVDPARVLGDLLEREALVARARLAGLDSDPEVRRGYENLLIARLKERELEPRFEAPLPTGATAAGTRPAAPPVNEVRLAMLRLQVGAKSSPARWHEAEARLNEARDRVAQLPAGAVGFGKLAVEYSDDDATRYRSGDLGWLEANPARYRWDTNALAAGMALTNPGDVSRPVRGADGMYLLRLVDRRTRARADRSADPGAQLYQARQEQRRAAEEEFAAETRRLVTITTNEPVVRQILDAWSAQRSPTTRPTPMPR